MAALTSLTVAMQESKPEESLQRHVEANSAGTTPPQWADSTSKYGWSQLLNVLFSVFGANCGLEALEGRAEPCCCRGAWGGRCAQRLAAPNSSAVHAAALFIQE